MTTQSEPKEYYNTTPESVVSVTRGHASEDVVALRQRFVVDEKKWLPETHKEGHDEYDDNLATLHLGRENADGQTIASMRLTRINNYEHSMSIIMLRGNEAMAQQALTQAQRFYESADDGNLWDLTRLVDTLEWCSPEEREEVVKAMLELLGAGLTVTRTPEHPAPIWIFTLESQLKDFLDACQIKTEVIARGKLNESDEYETLFCMIDPAESMQLLEENTSEESGMLFARTAIQCGRDNVKTV